MSGNYDQAGAAGAAPQLIDTHAHLTSEAFAGDLDDVLERARAVGVSQVISIADDADSSCAACALAERRLGVYATAGVHPHQSGEATQDDLRDLKRLLQGPRVVAVGEIGLDYHYDFASPEVQHEWMRAQLRLARDVGRPVVIHNREADADVLRLLEEEGAGEVGGVLHCFWSDAHVAQRALDLGFHLGVGGPVTFKSTEALREVLRSLPLDRLLVETDAPYLAPVPRRGKRNEPAFVSHTAEALAELHGIAVERVAQQTTENARRLFGLSDDRLGDDGAE